MIYTSYFAVLKKIPPEVTPIAICRKAPVWYDGRRYTGLEPSFQTLQDWRAKHDEAAYKVDFYKGLFMRDPRETAKALYDLAGTEDVVLLCYEKPDAFCHRHLVAAWFRISGIPCEEYVFSK